jgi:tetratricopeptide (TPR) repeat protein
LTGYDEALRYRDPAVVPLDYAVSRSNRALVCQDLARVEGEDRRGRLLEALAEHDEALRYRDPHVFPVEYARLQSNRGSILRDLAPLRGEDTMRRRDEAFSAFNAALRYYPYTGAEWDTIYSHFLDSMNELEHSMNELEDDLLVEEGDWKARLLKTLRGLFWRRPES